MFKPRIPRIPRPVFLVLALCATVAPISSPVSAQAPDRAAVEAARTRVREHEAADARVNAIKDSMAADDRARGEQAAHAQKMQDDIRAEYERARAIEIRRNARWQTKPNKSQAAWKAKNQLEWEQRDREAAERRQTQTSASAAVAPPP